jgi:hypothetical protein
MLAMQLFCHEHGDIQDGVKEEYRAGLEMQVSLRRKEVDLGSMDKWMYRVSFTHPCV